MDARKRYFAGLLISLLLLIAFFAKTRLLTPAPLQAPAVGLANGVLPNSVVMPRLDPPKNARAIIFPIDLNMADAERLSLLPGIGKKTSQRIIEKRREMGGFKSVEDLLLIPGIKQGRLNKLRPFVIVTSVK